MGDNKETLPQPSSKPLRSQPTRDRILSSAKRLFLQNGFENTTIRAVATEAGINASMVMRYYGNKEDLFRAAARIDFRMPDLSAQDPKKRGVALVTHLLQAWEGERANEELHVLLRAAGTHEAARKRLVALVEEQAVPAIRAVLPKNIDAEQALGLIMIQLAGLVLSRYFLQYASVVNLDRDTIIAEVGANVQRYLKGG